MHVFDKEDFEHVQNSYYNVSTFCWLSSTLLILQLQKYFINLTLYFYVYPTPHSPNPPSHLPSSLNSPLSPDLWPTFGVEKNMASCFYSIGAAGKCLIP
jgi:hypothetical protein